MCAYKRQKKRIVKKYDILGRRTDRVGPRERRKMVQLSRQKKSKSQIAEMLDRQTRTVGRHLALYEEEPLREQVKLQEQIRHLEDIGQRVKKLATELVLPPPPFLDIPDLSPGERHFPLGEVVRWRKADDESYMLRLSEEFGLVIEHLRSSIRSEHIDFLRNLERWQHLGGKCVRECHRLRMSIKEMAQTRTQMVEVPDTGQRGILHEFWWTTYSSALSDVTEEPKYIIASEHDDLCLLHQVNGPNLAWVRPDEVERLKDIHRQLRREHRALPLVNEILGLKAEMSMLREALCRKLNDLAKDVIGGKCGKCSACIM